MAMVQDVDTITTEDVEEDAYKTGEATVETVDWVKHVILMHKIARSRMMEEIVKTLATGVVYTTQI